MELGLIAGIVAAVAGVAAVVIAYLQLIRKPSLPQPWPPIDTTVHDSTLKTNDSVSGLPQPTPSAADFGLSVKVLTERLPAHVRGRRHLLRNLQRHLAQGGLVVLTGSGGMGKSTVARQLVRQMPDAAAGGGRPSVWEVSAADLPSLTGGLITIAADLGASESDLQAISVPTATGPDRFWKLLEQRAEGWLLIVDNADEQELLAAPAAPGSKNVPRLHDGTGWVRATRRGLVLVTSRRRENRQSEVLRGKSGRRITWPDEAIVYEVGPLSDSEAAQVLLDWAPRAGDRDQARKLGHRLGGLPLALKLAGQYLSSGYVNNPTFTAYLSALDSDPRMIKLLDPDLDDPDHVEREMVMFTWELSLNALADRGIPQARAILRLISCYAPAVPIPLSLFTSELLDPLLGMPVQGVTSMQIDRVLRGLDHLGLIDAARLSGNEAENASAGQRRRRLTLNEQNALVVHPVIADTNRVYLLDRNSAPDPLLVRGVAISLLATVLDNLSNDHPGDWPTFRMLTPHLQALLANSASQVNGETLDILIRVAGYTAMAYGQMRSPEFGLELVTSALTHTPQLNENPMSGVLLARQQMAHLLSQLSQPAEAQAIYAYVLRVQRRLWPMDDPAILATRRNLASSISAQGHSGEAKAAFQDVLEDQRRVLGEDDHNTLSTRLQLATLDDELPRAEGALRSLLADTQRVLGPDHTTTLVVRHNLAEVIRREGRRSEAEHLFGDLLEDEQRVLGDDHFLTASTRNFNHGSWITISSLSGPKLRKSHASRLFNKAVTLSQQQPDQAAEAYRQLIDRYGDDPDPALHELAAKARFNRKAISEQRETTYGTEAPQQPTDE